MRTRTTVAILTSAAALGALLIARPQGATGDGGPAPSADSPLVVHEWGTFTSLSGSDGVGLEGLGHEEEGLPSFVYSRAKVRECPLRAYGYKGLEVPADHVTQKMETPVLYFHTKAARRARVRVDFVRGLISQWYPVSDLLGPPETAAAAGPLDVSKIDRSFLQWDVDLIPKGADAGLYLPAVATDDPWAFARNVDAAAVRTVPRQAPERMGPTESERFLFYRGLGAFTLPIDVKAERGGTCWFANDGKETVPFAFSLRVFEKGGAAYRDLGAVEGLHGVDATLDPAVGDDAEKVAGRLKTAVASALVAQGLFADEAKAMVETWSRQWFLSEGTRIVYGVPRAWTDSILPLQIDPKPDSLVRLLVGRLEYLTPEHEASVHRALTLRMSKDAAERAAGETILSHLGRFLEPNMRRILAMSPDADVKKGAEQVLAALLSEQTHPAAK